MPKQNSFQYMLHYLSSQMCPNWAQINPITHKHPDKPKKQKQQKDYLKLKKQIEIIEKKRKMREEFGIQRKNDQKNENNKKQSKNKNTSRQINI